MTFVCNSVLTVTLAFFKHKLYFVPVFAEEGGGGGSCRVPHIVVYSYWLLTEDLFVAGQQLIKSEIMCVCVCVTVRRCHLCLSVIECVVFFGVCKKKKLF